MKIVCGSIASAIAVLSAFGGQAYAAGSCVPIETYVQSIKSLRDGDGCQAIDNGSVVLKICQGPDAARRVEVTAGKSPPHSLQATHVLTWASTMERSAPAGVQFSFSGLVLLGGDAALSVRYKDYVRGDSAVSGGSVAPADSVEIVKVDKSALTCVSAASMDDAALEAAVGAMHKDR